MESKETIFVAVASYRDPECLTTVEDIFLRAKYPERIRVAIVDQRTEGDPLCRKPVEPCEQNPEQVLCKYGHMIYSTEYPAQLMLRPVFARHLEYRMYRGEYFAMQVDSHVRFVANWDEDGRSKFQNCVLKSSSEVRGMFPKENMLCGVWCANYNCMSICWRLLSAAKIVRP
jgi:hypothetical protein